MSWFPPLPEAHVPPPLHALFFFFPVPPLFLDKFPDLSASGVPQRLLYPPPDPRSTFGAGRRLFVLKAFPCYTPGVTRNAVLWCSRPFSFPLPVLHSPMIFDPYLFVFRQLF